MRLLIQKRVDVPRWLTLVAPVISVGLAFLVGAAVIASTGGDPIKVYRLMLESSLFSRYGLPETIVKAIPLMLSGFALAVTMRMRVLNLGAEGQIYIGAVAAAWVAAAFGNLPAGLLLPLMFVAGLSAGGLWSLIAVLPRVLWNTSELITSLMMNYVAILWVAYLVNGPWRDPTARGFPLGPVFPEAGQLPIWGTTRVHLGLLIALVLAVLLALMLRRTRFGYQMQVIGASPRAARYAGMNIPRTILYVSLLSGGLAGLAGMTEVSGVIHRLQEGISPGYGFTAIIVSALARHNPFGILLVAFLFGALLVGGYAIQTVGVSSNIVQILQGAVLLFVVGSEFLLQYRVRLVGDGAGWAAKLSGLLKGRRSASTRGGQEGSL
jgi:simple sugar transport system permease protein